MLLTVVNVIGLRQSGVQNALTVLKVGCWSRWVCWACWRGAGPRGGRAAARWQAFSPRSAWP
jgi:hypothetical protein